MLHPLRSHLLLLLKVCPNRFRHGLPRIRLLPRYRIRVAMVEKVF
jgi:hypothetical protein